MHQPRDYPAHMTRLRALSDYQRSDLQELVVQKDPVNLTRLHGASAAWALLLGLDSLTQAFVAEHMAAQMQPRQAIGNTLVSHLH